MATPRKKLPDHITWAFELAETHHARITRLLDEINEVMTDRRGINKYALDVLLAKMSESNAVIGQAFASIERREPAPESSNGARPAVDRAWLLAMGRLAETENAGLVQAFIDAKLVELDGA